MSASPVELLDRVAILEAMCSEARARLDSLEVHVELDSTNRRLVDLSREASTRTVACLAERQTAGRGRRGRGWVSPFGGNVYLSLLWPFDLAAPAVHGLSIAAGVAAAEAVESAGAARIALKWPNDLLLDGRKLGGILIEIAGGRGRALCVVAGIGINVRMPAEDARVVDQPWADLSGIAGGPPSRNRLAGAVLERWVDAFARFEREGLAPFLDGWAARDALRDRPVVVVGPESTERGVARGIDASGALVFESADGLRRPVLSGDVSLRHSG